MGFWCHFGAKSCDFGSENVDFWLVEKQPFWEVNFGLKKGDFGSKCRFFAADFWGKRTEFWGPVSYGDKEPFWVEKLRFWV